MRSLGIIGKNMTRSTLLTPRETMVIINLLANYGNYDEVSYILEIDKKLIQQVVNKFNARLKLINK